MQLSLAPKNWTEQVSNDADYIMLVIIRVIIIRSSELKLVPQEYITETTSLSGFTEELNDLKEKVKEARASMTIKPYPKVLFLGTGSCIPNKTRNTSGILIQIR